MSGDSQVGLDNLSLAIGIACLAIFGYSQAWLGASIFDYRFAIVMVASMILAFSVGWSAIVKPSTGTAGQDLMFWQAISFAAGSLAILTALIVPFGSTPTFLLLLGVSATPFFLWALGLISISRTQSISVYGPFTATAAGACAGLALAPWLVQMLDGPVKASVAALIGGSGMTLLARRRGYILLASFVTIALLIGVGWATTWSLLSPPRWIQAKNPINKILNVPNGEAGITRFATTWDGFARIDIAAIRVYGQNMRAVFINGVYSGMTPAAGRAEQESGWLARHAPLVSLPLMAKNSKSVLIVNSTTGLERALAEVSGATHIQSLGREGSEARQVRNARDELPSATRRGLQRERQSYDLIYLLIPPSPVPGWSERGPVADQFYTKEAFEDYWRHLKPDGMLAIAAFEETLYARALFSAWEVLSEDPMSVTTYLTPQAWGFRLSPDVTPWAGSRYLFLLSKGGADQSIVTRISEHGSKLGLVPLFGPAIAPPVTFHIQENPYYILYHPGGLEPARKELQGYMGWEFHAPVDLTPATERRPFFFQNIRDLPPYFKALVLLCLSSLAAVLFLSCPAYRRPETGSFAFPLPIFLSYFLCLGTGAALASVALVYQGALLTLSLDRSLAAVLIALLLGAAASTIVVRSGFFTRSPGYLSVGAAFLVLALTPSILSKSELLGATESSAARLALLAVLAAPIGFISAILMPLGSRPVSQLVQGSLPWTWITLGIALLLGTLVAFWTTQMRGWPTVWALSIGCFMLTVFSAVILSKYQQRIAASGLPQQPGAAGEANALKLRAGKRRG